MSALLASFKGTTEDRWIPLTNGTLVFKPWRDHEWWRPQMETFPALLALCEGNPPVAGVFPSQSPVTRSFGVFSYLSLGKWLSKQSIRRWFKTPSHLGWHHCNGIHHSMQLANHSIWPLFTKWRWDTGVSYSVPLQHNYNLVVLWYELSNPWTKTMIIPGSLA